MLALLRVALAAGFAIDAGVGLLSLFAQPLIQPLFDIPVRDPSITVLYGGELLIVAVLYVMVFRQPDRWRPLLWLCAADQILGVVLPAIEIARGHVPGTFKTIAPMPFQLLLVIIYLIGARRTSLGRDAAT